MSQRCTAQPVASLLSFRDLYKLAQEKVPGSPAITPRHFHVIALHVIAQEEISFTNDDHHRHREWHSSVFLHRLAHIASDATCIQCPLQLVHVRLPPTNIRHPDEQSNPYFSRGATCASRHPQSPPTSRPYILSEPGIQCWPDYCGTSWGYRGYLFFFVRRPF
jgi:nuclear pore complex protein Nup155